VQIKGSKYTIFGTHHMCVTNWYQSTFLDDEDVKNELQFSR